MTHVEMDAIKVEDASVLLDPGLTPGGELLLQIAVESTDRTHAGSHSHQVSATFLTDTAYLLQ